MFEWPVAQKRQWPQTGRKEVTTWSPSLTRLTPGPTFSITPAPSWPPTTGKRGTMSPWRRCSSEWHSPAASKRIRTSCVFGSSSSSSATSQSRPSSHRTAALVFTTLLLRTDGGAIVHLAVSGDPGERLEGGVGLELAAHHRAVPQVLRRPVGQLVLQELLDARVALGDLVGLGQPGGA